MRAVVDTNILVRALIKPKGTVGPVLQTLRNKWYVLLYSDSLLEELLDVLHRPHIQHKYHLSEEDIETALAVILLRGEAVVSDRRVTICRDPKDNKVLEVATAGHADVIVSGDEDVSVLSPFEGIPIVRPAVLLAMLDRAAESLQ
ncbi:MAG: putative toxin-antitoxin system toxin component, PIN family [Chloroflexi bacterium HGW-Chloroflexi-1]|nr:MAG: putative toxin-antitoxin system toxin component, PIN family [Chloroflexi bacterium HGW-Chloroflexi-1]